MWLRALGTPATNLSASKGGVAVCRWLIRNDWRRRKYTISPPSRFKMEISMAKSNIRRTIIREWTSLAREKRQSRQQALAFTKAAVRTTSSATQPPNTGGHHHDLVAAAHRTTLKHVTKVAREKNGSPLNYSPLRNSAFTRRQWCLDRQNVWLSTLVPVHAYSGPPVDISLRSQGRETSAARG